MRTFIDVRTKEEFGEGSCPGAQNVPLDTLDSFLKTTNLPKDSEVFVFCASGGRSAMAKTLFEQSGFTKVINCINKEGAACLCQ